MRKKFSNKVVYRHARLSVIALILAICFMLPFQPVLALNAAAPLIPEVQSTEAPDPNTILPGDYDGDGIVTVQDAILTLRAAMGIITPLEQSHINADMDGDGALTVTDAITILRIAMGLIEPPAPPLPTGQVSVLFIGNDMIARDGYGSTHDSRLFFKSMCEAAGIDIYIDSIVRPANYYIYESALTGTNQIKVKEKLEEHKFDYVVVQVSKDYSLVTEANQVKEAKALANIENYLEATNTDGRLVLFGSTGRNNLRTSYWTAFVREKDWSTPREHNDAIREYVQYQAGQLKKTPLIADVATAFEEMQAQDIEVFHKDYIDYPSVDGSFVTAATFFKTIFGRSAKGFGRASVVTDADERLVISKKLAKLYNIEPEEPEPFGSKMNWSEEDRTNESFVALKAVAEAFYGRREWLQYDQLSRNRMRKTDHRGSNFAMPEDGTAQQLLYTDCAYFVRMCYYNAFGYEFKHAFTTDGYESYIGEADSNIVRFSWHPEDGNEEDAANEFLAALEPGDVIGYRYGDNSNGHVLLYVGNGLVLHSTGIGSVDYKYPRNSDNYEPAGTVVYSTIDELLQKNSVLYLFHDKSILVLLRPFDDPDLPPITENTAARVNGLQNIVVSKTTSHPDGVTANPGDPVRFTVSVKNNGSDLQIITIRDTVPEGMTGNNFEKTIAVQPGEMKEVSYTFRVNKEAECDRLIECANTVVNGVKINNCPVYVMRTLTKNQQRQFTDAALTVDAPTDALDIARQAYKKAFGYDLPIVDFQQIYDMIFDTYERNYSSACVKPKTDGNTFNPIRDMMVETIYGGENTNTNEKLLGKRTSDPRIENVLPGDLIVTFDAPWQTFREERDCNAFICLNNGELLSVKNGEVVHYDTWLRSYSNVMTTLLGQCAFCLLRPSAVMLEEPVEFPETTEEDPLNILFVGSDLISSSGRGSTQDPTKFFESMCAAAEVNVHVDKIVKPWDYNIWEFGTAVHDKLAGNTKYDYVVVQAGRDYAMLYESTRKKELKELQAVQTSLEENNPDGKLVLLVPPYRSNFRSSFWTKFVQAKNWSTVTAHSDAINHYVRNYEEGLNNPVTADVLTAFKNMMRRGVDVFHENYIDYPSVDGSFVTAATIFEAIFKHSAYGFGSAEAEADTGERLVISGRLAEIYGIEPVEPEPFGSKLDWSKEDRTDEKFLALKAAAEAFYDRREWVQFDELGRERVFKTAHRGNDHAKPEDATAQKYLYTDSAYFVRMCYYNAFEYDFGGYSFTKSNLDSHLNYLKVFSWTKEEDKAQAAENLVKTLKPGDVIAIESGKAMLYLGNGLVMQSTYMGRMNYDYKGKSDNHERGGAIICSTIDELLNERDVQYLFQSTPVHLLRPMEKKTDLSITPQAAARVTGLQDIIVCKTTSHPEGITANPGDSVKFTISVRNIGVQDRTITITDTVPDGMTGDNFTVTIVVPAGETNEVSYTFSVNAEAACPQLISCENTVVNGVTINNCPVYVMRTLTGDQQQNFAEEALKIKNAANGLDLAKQAYANAFGFDLPIEEMSGIFDAIFRFYDKKSVQTTYSYRYTLSSDESPIRSMLVESIYGGQNVRTPNDPPQCERTSDPRFENLIAGDLLVTFDDGSSTTPYTDWSVTIYVCLGNGELLNVKNGEVVRYDTWLRAYANVLTTLFGRHAFCLLRPSAVMP